MEWINNLNRIMAYIEDNLDGEPDKDEIARLAACPYVLFQRVFAILANVSLTDYIRNRRLTKAAYALRIRKAG
jgi:AraC family transcriptional regulator